MSWSLKCHRGFGETCSLHLWEFQNLQHEKAAVIITELLPRLQTPAFRRTGTVQKSLVENVNSADVLKTRFGFDTWGSLSGDNEVSCLMGCYALSLGKYFPTFRRSVVPSSLQKNSLRIALLWRRHWRWKHYDPDPHDTSITIYPTTQP